VSSVVFYERGFGVLSHRFLRSLLQHYVLELQNLTPCMILHIPAFMTLCETYMGIDPHFDLWNQFFRVQRLQDPDAEMLVSREVVVQVKSRHGVDPYFDILMPKLMEGWWKCGSTSGTTLSPNPTGGTGWLRRTSASCSPDVSLSNSYVKRG
jgi:hypothetical protein